MTIQDKAEIRRLSEGWGKANTTILDRDLQIVDYWKAWKAAEDEVEALRRSRNKIVASAGKVILRLTQENAALKEQLAERGIVVRTVANQGTSQP
jgi:hypothetical protein